MSVIVIVGASHAAVEVIANLRKKGCTDKIILVGEEPYLPYHRPPLSKDYFKGEIQEKELLLRERSFYELAEVELKLNCRATAIERQGNILKLEDGSKLNYDKLILATGTRPRTLPVAEALSDKLHYLRNKQDIDRILDQQHEQSKLLIIGAGYIGLEVAASAISKQNKVTVVETADRVLARVTSPLVSEFYQSVHEDNGVQFILDAQLQGFRDDNGAQAILTDNTTIPFDIGIIGIGVIPNIELASKAGLACDNGILVDQHGCTEDPDIYAIGDCSNHPSVLYNRRLRLESIPNAAEQAKVAAGHLCGENIIHDAIPWFWSDQYDIKLQTAGLLQGYDHVVTRGDVKAGKFSAFYLSKGRLIAMDAINSPADFLQSKKLIQRKAHPAPDMLADTTIPLKTLLTQVT